MKRTAVLLLGVAAFMSSMAATEQVFTGVITDTMCLRNHKMMNITPHSRCAQECVKANNGAKYALQTERSVYKLSDQATPAQHAGKRVRVSGTLYPKTGVIKVEGIRPAN